VSALMPCERRNGSKSGNRAAGKEFPLHCETRRGSTPSRAANANVPPRASIHSAAVEQVFMRPIYPQGADYVKSRNVGKFKICAVVPVRALG
jgi:hypothetical protein